MQLTATALQQAATRTFPWRRLLAVVFFTLALQALVALVLIALYASQPEEAGLRIAAAQQVPEPDLTLLQDDAWHALELPEKLCRSDCTSRFKVYRFDAGTPPDAAGLALYVRMFDGAMAAYLNGELIGQTGSLRDPTADMTYHPAYFDIPEPLWSSTANTLDIIVASLVPAGGRLTAPFIGERGSLHASWRVAHGLTVDLLAIVNGILLTFLFASVLLYFAAGRDHLFIWFALLVVFCVARNLNVLLPEWPAGTVARSAIYLCTTLGVLLAAGSLISRLVAKRESWADIALALAWLPGSLIIIVGLQQDVQATWAATNSVIRVLTLTLGTWLVVRFLLYSRTLPPAVQGSLFALLGAALALMLHDTIGSSPPRVLLFQTSNLAALPLVLSFCVVLAHRYREYLRRISNQNRMLSAAVVTKEAELASSYEELAKAREAQVLAEERQRIMQDMHDGVGGRLAALLQRLRLEPARNARLASELQSSLNDLRLIIDSLDTTGSDSLAFALGTFRQRIEPWLTEHGIELVWSIGLDSEHRFGPERTLQIYRILQEALNNVVRHANARRVAIRVNEHQARLELAIEDDGVGLPEDRPSGRGLDIMRRRAAAMNGEMRIESSAAGTALSVTLPLDPP